MTDSGSGVSGALGVQRGLAPANESARRKELHRNEDIEDRMAELSLLCEALWSVLSETSGLTDMQLLDRIKEIDLHDGVLDRRKAHVPPSCGSCGAKVPNTADVCVFCSAVPPARNPFSS